jgi:hypothetical protein
MCDRHLKQHGILILLPWTVVAHYTLSMLLGYPDVESGGAVENVLTASCALVLSTLKSELASPVSRRDALNVLAYACSKQGENLIYVGEGKGQKDGAAVLRFNRDTSCPVPRSTRGTGVFYRILSRRRQLSVQRVATRN